MEESPLARIRIKLSIAADANYNNHRLELKISSKKQTSVAGGVDISLFLLFVYNFDE